MTRIHPRLRLLSVALLALLLPLPGLPQAAQEKPDADPAQEKAAPPLHIVKKVALKNNLQLDAVFEAAEAFPISLGPESWTDLSVLEALPHGSEVKKGDLLVKFDTEKITEQIDDQKQGRRTSKLALDIARAELDNLEQATPLKMEAARRAKRQADEDYNYFQETDRAQKEKAVQFSLKNAEQRLRYATEELDQLKKMYDADDLTEETEEIILERQKHTVEAAEYGLEVAKLNAERTLSTSIPREHEALKAKKLEQELALELSEETLFKNLQQKRLAVEKLERDQAKGDQKLAELQDDLEKLHVAAPADGLLYYGAFENGKWATGAAVAKKLVSGGKIAPREVFLTIVNPNRLVLNATAPEDKLSQLKPGLKGHAVPAANPDAKLAVKLEHLGQIPLPTGGFAASFSVKPDPHARLVPGMNCKISFDASDADPVLAVPEKAVISQDNKKIVYLHREAGDPEKRTVKTGRSDGELVEILDGLDEGDKILLQKPE